MLRYILIATGGNKKNILSSLSSESFLNRFENLRAKVDKYLLENEDWPCAPQNSQRLPSLKIES